MHREGVIAAIIDQIKASLEERAQETTKSWSSRETLLPMTLLITRDVADRIFLASIMPEVATGVFYLARAVKGLRDAFGPCFQIDG
jgi:hypothetical protein